MRRGPLPLRWIQVEFAGSKTIDEISVFSLHDNYTQENTPTETQTFSLYGLLAFDVQYWNGSSWTTIPGGSVTGNNKVWRKFTFSAVTTSKIRVYINAVPDAWSRVVEIQAFGTSAGGEKVQWLVPDHLGTPRIVLDQTGSLAGVKRHDYLPFGEQLYAGMGSRTVAQGYSTNDGVRQQFTSKERDIETGLDYFEARYYQSTQGRFTSPDPVFFQKEMLLDPQRFNLYGYVRNNPLKLVDPKGLAIELTGDEAERKRKLELLRQALGTEAGAYLYENKGKDGKYYVGIYTNGPDGKSKSFEQVNSVAGDVAKVIRDSFVAEIELVPQGFTAKFEGGEYTIGRVDPINNAGPGATYVQRDGRATIWLLDPKYDPGKLPAAIMENNQALQVILSDALAHEIGHVEARWGYVTGPSNTNAVDLENRARKLRDPSAPLRYGHNLGTPRDAVGPQPLIINVRPGTEGGWRP